MYKVNPLFIEPLVFLIVFLFAALLLGGILHALFVLIFSVGLVESIVAIYKWVNKVKEEIFSKE